MGEKGEEEEEEDEEEVGEGHNWREIINNHIFEYTKLSYLESIMLSF